MLLTLPALKDLLGTVALMALLAVAYGTLVRTLRPVGAQATLGVLFGSAAVLSMADSLRVAEGVIVDLRNVPVALAGAYLGLPGAAVATVMAIGMRAWLGGSGALAGVTGILAACLVGLAWAALRRAARTHGARTHGARTHGARTHGAKAPGAIEAWGASGPWPPCRPSTC